MKDRDALYYPYIHVRDVNWLKGTLLCFPHVFRMAPRGFAINDTKDVRPFSKTLGRRKRPLLDEAWLNRSSVLDAQDRFRKRLVKDYDKSGTSLHERFSLVRAKRDFADGENIFQIHRDKFSMQLLDFLEETGLAWKPQMQNKRRMWVAVHPTLGEAFMSTLAAAVARENGLDVVTSSGPIHTALALKNENAIYDQLIAGRQIYTKPKKSQIRNQLLELVVQTRFDVSGLSAKAIASMSKDREGLFALKNEISAIAARIPAIENRKRRDQYLSEAADEIIENWQDSKKSMTKFTQRFFGSGLAANATDFVKTIAKSMVGGGVVGAAGSAAAGSTTATASATLIGGLTLPVFLGAGAGLAVGVVVHGITTAAKMYKEEAESPYRYFSRIEKRGGRFIVAAPCGRAGVS